MKKYKVQVITEYEKDGETKSFFRDVGSGIETKNGGIMVNLFSLPLSGKLFISEDDGSGRYGKNQNRGYGNKQQGGGSRENDDVPF